MKPTAKYRLPRIPYITSLQNLLAMAGSIPFGGGIFSIMEQFDTLLSKVVDLVLGKCCQSFGCSYSEVSSQQKQVLKFS